MSEPAKQNATKKQGKQPNRSGITPPIKSTKEIKQPPSHTKLLFQETRVITRRGKDAFKEGSRGADTAAPFIEVPLNSSQSSVEVSYDDDFEKIGTTHFSHEGQSHSAYNGQPDHVCKYPKDFGKKAGGK